MKAALNGYSSLTSAVVNVSTSAQIAHFLDPANQNNSNLAIPAKRKSQEESQAEVEWPFKDGVYARVAASLNGGNVLKEFILGLQTMLKDLGAVDSRTQQEFEESALWTKVIEASNDTLGDGQNDAYVTATLFGERHDPGAKMSIGNVQPGSGSLGRMYRSLCKGLASNLGTMLSGDRLREHGVERILGCGSCLGRNPGLVQAIRDEYGLEVILVENGDSAFGAALFLLD